TRLDAENLKPSKFICDRLTHYKAILPANNAEFLTHGNAFFGGSIPAGGHPDYGSGWYNIWKNQYDSSHGTLGKQAAQNIIDLYFPGGCPAAAPAPTVTVTSQSICSGQSATLTASGAMYYQWSNGETGNTITVSPISTTTYTVIGKTAGLNAAPATAEVTVNPIPVVSVNNTTICEGQSATLTASGAETYVWSTGESGASIIVSPTETTTFTVTGTTAACAAAPLTAEVTVNPVPEVTVSHATICEGQSATLTASGAETYTWSTGESGTSIIVSPTETTTFTVTGTTSACAAPPLTAEVTVNPVPEVAVGHATICAGQSATLTASGAETYVWSTGESGASITVSPSESTTFTVTGTTGGCAAAPLTAEVTVNPVPEITVSHATICEGQSATLTASGAETYVWSTGESGAIIIVSPTETTTFTVVGNSLGCSSLPTPSLVTVNSLPSVTITTEQQGQYTLVDAAGQGLTYLWSTGESTSSILVNISGIYTVTVTNDAGCSAVFSISVTVISSVKDPYDGIEIGVAPNPVKDMLNILVSGSSTTNIRILDKLGRVVLEEQTFIPDGTLRTLNVARLPAGAYYLQISGANFVKTLGIVK
ncbi:MAG: T9SS type A sorting domain-containing protein, partial [Saprospiraceae bacterium]